MTQHSKSICLHLYLLVVGVDQNWDGERNPICYVLLNSWIVGSTETRRSTEEQRPMQSEQVPVVGRQMVGTVDNLEERA